MVHSEFRIPHSAFCMTFPTQLSLLRVLLTFVVIFFTLHHGWPAKLAALALFMIASFTDWLDGWVARRYKTTSAAGAIVDPIADKVLVLGLLLTFAYLRLVPAWMVWVIAARELIVTTARMVALKRGTVLSAERMGKQKTFVQLATLEAVFIILLSRALGADWAASSWTDTLILAGMWLTLTLTLLSGLSFFLNNSKALLRSR